MDIAAGLALRVGFFVRLEARFSVPTRAVSTAARAEAVKDARLRARKGLSNLALVQFGLSNLALPISSNRYQLRPGHRGK
jgi:hypothetical protein